MLVNISFLDRKTQELIDTTVGQAFPLIERLKMKGVGSPRLLITDGSPDLKALFEVNLDTTYCNVELRPKGIIIRFRSLLDTYALIIPYYSLTVYQMAELWQFHIDGQFISAVPELNKNSNRKFLIKLLGEKAKVVGGGPNG